MNWENPVPGRWFSGAAAVCLGFALAGCGSSMISTNATPAPVMQDASLAFVANTSSNTISAFQVDPSSGKLFPVVGNPFPTDSGPEFLAVSAASKFLFPVLSRHSRLTPRQARSLWSQALPSSPAHAPRG